MTGTEDQFFSVTYRTEDGTEYVLRYTLEEDVLETIEVDTDGPGGLDPVTATRVGKAAG